MNDDVKAILEKSGHSLHYKVIELLRDRGWDVLVSPYYSDGLTGKPREIDIIAERPYDVEGNFHSWIGTLNIRLFIECKYINRKELFWFDKKDHIRALSAVIQETSLERPQRWPETNNHHWLSKETVAKLFSMEGEEKNQDGDPIYKGINQSLNAMVYHKTRPSIITPKLDTRISVLKTINYPIIVFNSFDKFYKHDTTNKEPDSAIINNFQLEVNYAYRNTKGIDQSEYFLIDMIELAKLEDFLNLLEKTDISIIQDKLLWDDRTSS